MTETIPSYRQRKGYDQAIVTLRDAETHERHDYWLGTYGTPESRQAYHQLIAAWEAAGRRLPEPLEPARKPVTASVTVEEVIGSYWTWAKGYYTAAEVATIKATLRILRRLFGTTPAVEFGPKCMRLVREEMVRGDSTATPPRAPWARRQVNAQVHRLAAMFKWAASHELVPATVYQQLKTLEPLKRGRTPAREPVPVTPVEGALVDGIAPFVSRQIWALIQLQRMTGARCGELFKMRQTDLDMNPTSGIWIYAPQEHKMAHRGRKRTIYLGPRAQQVLAPFLESRAPEAYLFSPAEAETQRRTERHKQRQTPLSCGNRPGTHVVDAPERSPGDHYTTDSYRRAIVRGCAAAFPPPAGLARQKVQARKGKRWETIYEWQKRLGPEGWQRLAAWRREHSWHPHQLRHTAATEIRRQFGLEAAQIALGHSSALVTEAVYAQRDMAKVTEVMTQIG